MTDWDKRARDVMISLHNLRLQDSYGAGVKAALQLGQEMQAETREILHEKILALETKVEALEELRTKAADARAEEIARRAEGHINDPRQGDQVARAACAIVARDVAWFARHGTKKTREEVLEDALRKVSERLPGYSDEAETGDIARRALEEADRLRSS